MSEKGYLPHHKIKAFVFWVLTLCILTATLAGILYSWGSIGRVFANRCFWTAVMLSLGSLAFLLINRLFGDLGRTFFDDSASGRETDPGFAERLRRAKAEGRAGE